MIKSYSAPNNWEKMTFGEVRVAKAARAELCGAAASPVRDKGG